jgi:hypothetical protein
MARNGPDPHRSTGSESESDPVLNSYLKRSDGFAFGTVSTVLGQHQERGFAYIARMERMLGQRQLLGVRRQSLDRADPQQLSAPASVSSASCKQTLALDAAGERMSIRPGTGAFFKESDPLEHTEARREDRDRTRRDTGWMPTPKSCFWRVWMARREAPMLAARPRE